MNFLNTIFNKRNNNEEVERKAVSELMEKYNKTGNLTKEEWRRIGKYSWGVMGETMVKLSKE